MHIPRAWPCDCILQGSCIPRRLLCRENLSSNCKNAWKALCMCPYKAGYESVLTFIFQLLWRTRNSIQMCDKMLIWCKKVKCKLLRSSFKFCILVASIFVLLDFVVILVIVRHGNHFVLAAVQPCICFVCAGPELRGMSSTLEILRMYECIHILLYLFVLFWFWVFVPDGSEEYRMGVGVGILQVIGIFMLADVLLPLQQLSVLNIFDNNMLPTFLLVSVTCCPKQSKWMCLSHVALLWQLDFFGICLIC